MKKHFTIIILILLIAGFTIAQTPEEIKKRLPILLNDSDTVYVIPNTSLFHLRSCELLGNRKTGMSLKSALQRGLKPCPHCLPLKPLPEPKPKKTTTLTKVKSKKAKVIDIEKNGYRNALWGMTESQVRKTENSKFLEKQHSSSTGLDIIAYQGDVGGNKSLIAYYFAEGKLVEGRYIFLEEHSNRNLYIEDYHDIAANLESQYGNPSEKDTIWSDPLYQDDFSDWGMAVAVGHVIFQSIWNLKGTRILLTLNGDNYKITHALSYKTTNPKYLDLVKKAEEKAKKGIW